jgi:hypothetical protein
MITVGFSSTGRPKRGNWFALAIVAAVVSLDEFVWNLRADAE